MRLDVVPEGLPERLALAAGAIPTPLLHTLFAHLLARTLVSAVRLGVFEALKDAPRTADEVATECGTNARATARLLGALVAARYLRADGNRYELRPVSRKWLLADSDPSLVGMISWNHLEAEMLRGMEDFLRTGHALDFHDQEHSPEDWSLYQRGMRSLASVCAAEIAKRMPVRRAPRTMLDIGGSHGLFAVAMCRRHPALRATILELPEAIPAAAALLKAEGMHDRVVHEPGDAMETDLGTDRYDIVLISNLVHHFDDAANRDLARRVAQSLRPGGVYVVQDLIRQDKPGAGGQFGGLMDLYFAMTSRAGTWSVAEIQSWQREAGLRPDRTIIWLRTLPGQAQVAASNR